jgi:carbonic anhydrase
MSNKQTLINISPKNISNRCDLKCSYNFKYPDCNTTATNNGVYISLTYENGNTPPVMYNNAQYTVYQINLFAPSLHLFNGVKTAGELIAVHSPMLGGSELLVCIPMIQSGDTTSASDILTQVIDEVAKSAPRNGESTNLNISNFSLQHIIPKKPFISYTGAYNQTTTDFIVFPIHAPIPLTQKTLGKLNSIVIPFNLPMHGGKLYINSKGPNSSGNFKGEDIYISCKPTGASDEVSYVTQPSTSSSSSSSSSDNSVYMDFLKFLILCIIFIAFFLGINYAFNAITKVKINLPGMHSKS